MTRKPVEVKEPVVSVEHDRHTSKQVFLLPDDRHWFPAPRGKKFGPAFVCVTKRGTKTVTKAYKLTDPAFWRQINTEIKAGVWALLDKSVSPLLPDDLVAASKRFNGTTADQRKQMSERMSKPAKKRNARKRR